LGTQTKRGWRSMEDDCVFSTSDELCQTQHPFLARHPSFKRKSF
jgi:hypothetical protein